MRHAQCQPCQLVPVGLLLFMPMFVFMLLRAGRSPTLRRRGEPAPALYRQDRVRAWRGRHDGRWCQPDGSAVLGAAPHVREGSARSLDVPEVPRRLQLRVDRRQLRREQA